MPAYGPHEVEAGLFDSLERTLDLLKQPLLKPLIDIPRMAELAQAMLKDALDAFVNQNADLARAVCRLVDPQSGREALERDAKALASSRGR